MLLTFWGRFTHTLLVCTFKKMHPQRKVPLFFISLLLTALRLGDVDPNAALLRIFIQAGSKISRQGNGKDTQWESKKQA